MSVKNPTYILLLLLSHRFCLHFPYDGKSPLDQSLPFGLVSVPRCFLVFLVACFTIRAHPLYINSALVRSPSPESGLKDVQMALTATWLYAVNCLQNPPPSLCQGQTGESLCGRMKWTPEQGNVQKPVGRTLSIYQGILLLIENLASL